MVTNVLTGMQKPSFDDFSKKRVFQDFAPRSSGFQIQFDVEASVKRALSGGIRNSTSAQKRYIDPSTKEEKEKTYVATIFDMPILGNFQDDSSIYEWLKVYFSVDISTKEGIEKMNYLLDWGLYHYNWTYYSSVPKQLQVLKFNSTQDIVRFVRSTSLNHRESSINRQVLLCMMGSGMIFQNQGLSEIGRYLKDFKNTHIQPNFFFRLDEKGKGEGVFAADIGNGEHRDISFKLNYRGKGAGSIHKKLLSRPEIKEEDVFNDALGFEFEVATKDDIIFLLNHIFSHIVIKNYTINMSQDVKDFGKVVEQLKSIWGFDLRQINLLSEEDISGFIQRYPHALHHILRELLTRGELKNTSKLMTGKGFSNVKYQGIFNFTGGAKQASVEIRIVLQGNSNNDGLEHQDIRDGERVMRVKSRLAHAFTSSYIDRLARIVLQNLVGSKYSNETTPKNIGALLEHYTDSVEAITLLNGSKVPGYYVLAGEGERLGYNGIQIKTIK